MMVFLKDFFEKLIFKKNPQKTKKHGKLASMQRVKEQIQGSTCSSALQLYLNYIFVEFNPYHQKLINLKPKPTKKKKKENQKQLLECS